MTFHDGFSYAVMSRTAVPILLSESGGLRRTRRFDGLQAQPQTGEPQPLSATRDHSRLCQPPLRLAGIRRSSIALDNEPYGARGEFMGNRICPEAPKRKGNSSDRQSRQRRRYLWSAGQPQELAKVLADDNNISSGDREALLHAFAREFSDYPTAVRLPPCETWRLANASHGRHERRPVPSRALERHGRT